MNGEIVTTSYATYWDDNTRRIQGGVSATVEIELQGDKIKGFWLKLPGELLTKLGAANTQASSQNPQGGDKKDTANPAGTSAGSASAAKSALDVLGKYAWLAAPGAVGAVVALAAFGFWLPRRRLGHRV